MPDFLKDLAGILGDDVDLGAVPVVSERLQERALDLARSFENLSCLPVAEQDNPAAWNDLYAEISSLRHAALSAGLGEFFDWLND